MLFAMWKKRRIAKSSGKTFYSFKPMNKHCDLIVKGVYAKRAVLIVLTFSISYRKWAYKPVPENQLIKQHFST